MIICEYLSDCMFITDNVLNIPEIDDELMNKFCRNNFINCARYLVAIVVGEVMVPAGLTPNQVDLADKIISCQ